MSKNKPFTKVEIIEEARDDDDYENGFLVKPSKVLVNGQPVRVERHGIVVEPGGAMQVSRVQLTLLVDEVSIRRVPNGYTEGKTSTSTGAHLHFEGPVCFNDVSEFAEYVTTKKRRRERLQEDFNNDDFD